MLKMEEQQQGAVDSIDEVNKEPHVILEEEATDSQQPENNESQNPALNTIVPEATDANFTYPNALKEVIKLAAPYVGSSSIVIGGNFVGVVFISKLGSEALAASNLTSAMQNWFTSTIGATLAATAIVAGRKIGNNEQIEVGGILHRSWFFTWIMSVPSVTIMLLSKPILSRLGQDPAIVELSEKFFQGYAWGLPAMFMLSCNRRIALATSNPAVGFGFDIFYQLLDTGLSYCFIFGPLFFPKLGFSGLGYSNSITAWTTFLLFTLFMSCSKRFQPYQLMKFRSKNFFPELWQLVKLGLPIGFKVGAELVSVLVASIMIGSMGADQQAAQEASFQYIFILSTPIFGIMDAVSTLVSRSIGENNNVAKAKKIGNVGILLSSSISAIGLVLFVSMPNILLGVFMDPQHPDNQQIMSIGRTLMIINGVGLLGDSVRNVSSGALGGFYDTLVPTGIILGTILAVNLPLSYVFGFTLGLEASGIMLGRATSITIGAMLLMFRWALTRQPNDNKPKVVNEESLVEKENAPNDQTTAGEQTILLNRPERSGRGCLNSWASFFGSRSRINQADGTDEEDHVIGSRSRGCPCTIL